MSIGESKLFNFIEVFPQEKFKLEGNCTITNFKKGDKIIPNPIVIRKKDGITTINGLAEQAYKNIAQIGNIFAKLTAMDNDASNLTKEDLEIAKRDYTSNKSVWESFGVVSFRYDANANVANIKTQDGELLHIEFDKTTNPSKKQTTLNSLSITQSNSKTEIKQKNNNSPVSASKTQKQVKVSNKKIQNNTNKIDDIISNFSGGNINIEDVHDLKTVAKYTGISTNYIKNILVGIEGRHNWPLTTAEYDGVPDKTHPNGHLTIGFGHTSLSGEPIVEEGMTITKKQAYQILANDIMQAKKMAKYMAGDLYSKAPQSIQNAMIDLAFNKGPGSINNHLKANLSKKYYGAAALRTWYKTTNVGLKKRNMLRFIEACRNISLAEKQKGTKKFYNEHIYDLHQIFKKDVDAKNTWNNFCKSIKCTKFIYY